MFSIEQLRSDDLPIEVSQAIVNDGVWSTAVYFNRLIKLEKRII